ncbi:DUF47 domain-containing protein [Trueperella bialowiezensis]|uniref:DUF47 domain-containing protein n=1 Tax=Trueperella bialowiezensis TaxID=312285 RepID=UPI0013DE8E16|nr:DUF47 family protein [Trueperella bialowiezensis]
MPLLNEQAEHLVRAAKVLAKMVAADSKTRTDMNTQLHEIENSADEASHRVMQEVGSRFALPFDRADLLSLSCRIDDCVDAIDEAGDNLVLYRIGPVPAGVYEIADILIECAEHAVHAIKKLKKSDPALRTEWLQIHNLENRADGIYRELIIELFSSDPTPKALLTSKIALDSFEAAVDAFEQLAVAIELLTLKES